VAEVSDFEFGQRCDFGDKTADRKTPTEVFDIPATVLNLLGNDHTKLTVRHNGIDRRLTDVHGHVIHELLV
jgi:arylsulfatase A-like enzyme